MPAEKRCISKRRPPNQSNVNLNVHLIVNILIIPSKQSEVLLFLHLTCGGDVIQSCTEKSEGGVYLFLDMRSSIQSVKYRNFKIPKWKWAILSPCFNCIGNKAPLFCKFGHYTVVVNVNWCHFRAQSLWASQPKLPLNQMQRAIKLHCEISRILHYYSSISPSTMREKRVGESLALSVVFTSHAQSWGNKTQH